MSQHIENIQALLFDFGGTIDTGGRHWLHVLYPIWEDRLPGLDPVAYRQAFAHGERTLAKERIIEPGDNFLDLLEKKLAIQAAFLKESNIACTIRDQKAVADQAYQEALDNCQQHGLIIKQLRQRFRVAMVSNFYGNLNTVLEDFGIADLFETITESAVAGVKKPDPKIWQMGCDSLGLAPSVCAVVGDSLTKDMEPAAAIGCRGLWLQGKGWEDDPAEAAVARQTAPADNLDNIQPLYSLNQIITLLK